MIAAFPYSYGFHCDGTCFNSYRLGGDKGLIEDLSSVSPDLAKHFMSGSFANGSNVRNLKLNLSNLHPTQDYVDLEKRNAYGTGKLLPVTPFIFRWNQLDFILTYPEFLLAAKASRQGTVDCYYVDIDSIKREYNVKYGAQHHLR